MEPSQIVSTTVSTWQEQRPDLDFSSMHTVLRLGTAMKLVVELSERALAPLGVSLGEFDVLATLRRHGSRASLTPSQVAELTMISPSGLTNRLARLEKAGYVARTMDPNDRRRFLATLTARGAKVADRGVELLVALDDRLVPEVPERNAKAVTAFLDAMIADASGGER